MGGGEANGSLSISMRAAAATLPCTSELGINKPSTCHRWRDKPELLVILAQVIDEQSFQTSSYFEPLLLSRIFSINLTNSFVLPYTLGRLAMSHPRIWESGSRRLLQCVDT